MDADFIDTQVSRIGARLKVADHRSHCTRTAGTISLDMQTDGKGQFFESIRQPGDQDEIAVLDVWSADRH